MREGKSEHATLADAEACFLQMTMRHVNAPASSKKEQDQHMIEVEIKLPVRDRRNLQKKLEEDGFVKSHLVRETDRYFNGVDRDFKKTDEAFRIRKTEWLERSALKEDSVLTDDVPEQTTYITYKGPKLGNVGMSRKELETTVGDAKVMREILISLGYRPVQPVVKTRQYYSHKDMTACVDQVEGLGDYLELEVLVDAEGERPQALKRIKEQLKKLGYSMGETTRISYLSMLEENVKMKR